MRIRRLRPKNNDNTHIDGGIKRFKIGVKRNIKNDTCIRYRMCRVYPATLKLRRYSHIVTLLQRIIVRFHRKYSTKYVKMKA